MSFATQADAALFERAKVGLQMVAATVDPAINATVDATVAQQVQQAVAHVLYADGGMIGSATPPELAPVALLTSAARTTTTASADQIATVARGAVVVLDLTAFTTAASLILKIRRKNDDASYTDIATAAAALTAVGKQVVVLDPLAGAEIAGFDKCVSGALPRDWGIQVVHGNGNSHTYAVSAYLIR